jgi:hypothetical protein
MKNRYDHKWRGKRLGDMNKEELIDALIESNTKLMDSVREQEKQRQSDIDFINGTFIDRHWKQIRHWKES